MSNLIEKFKEFNTIDCICFLIWAFFTIAITLSCIWVLASGQGTLFVRIMMIVILMIEAFVYGTILGLCLE